MVGSAILGYIMAGLFKAAEFNMSTWVTLLAALATVTDTRWNSWIPFFLALFQTLVGYLGCVLSQVVEIQNEADDLVVYGRPL